MEKSKKEEHSENSTLKWFIQVFTMTFILSIIFSYISKNFQNYWLYSKHIFEIMTNKFWKFIALY